MSLWLQMFLKNLLSRQRQIMRFGRSPLQNLKFQRCHEFHLSLMYPCCLHFQMCLMFRRSRTLQMRR
jgi:hypothetical protein